MPKSKHTEAAILGALQQVTISTFTWPSFTGRVNKWKTPLMSGTDLGGTSLRLRSGEQRFYEAPLAFRFPLFFSGIAEVCEWFDDEEGCFRIRVSASNKTWGHLFGYSGRFQVHWRPTPPNFVPDAILPRRVEART